MAGLEGADHDVGPDLQAHVVARVDAEQVVEHGLDPVGLLDLDEHGGRQLAGPRQQRVVDRDLLGDLPGVDDALGADHLLDLEPHGLAALEHKRQVATDGHPPLGLQRDDRAASLVAHLLVLVEVQDLVDRDRGHAPSRP